MLSEAYMKAWWFECLEDALDVPITWEDIIALAISCLITLFGIGAIITAIILAFAS